MKRVVFLLIMIILSTSVMGISLKSEIPAFEVNGVPLKKIGGAWLFEPGFSFSAEYVISRYNYGDAEPYLAGDLMEYATITKIQKFDDQVLFNVLVQLPEELESGDHELFVGAKEKPPENAGIVLTSRAQKLYIFKVLYKERIANFHSLNTPDVNENEETTFSFTAESVSEQEITNIYGSIFIHNFDNELVRTLRVPSFNLESAEAKTIEVDFDSARLIAGEYSAKADIFWEGEKTELTSKFNIGTLNIEILNFTRNFTSGQINKIDIDVESKWNGQPEFFAEIFLNDNLITTTQTYILEPFETKRITGFLDLTDFGGGDYDFKIVLKYGSQSTTKEEVINIFGEEKEEKKSRKQISISFNMTEIIMIMVIIVLILIVVILFQQKKKK
ncbi:hypothetical protein ACFLTH_15585 [Bacteroidota bacterium]